MVCLEFLKSVHCNREKSFLYDKFFKTKSSSHLFNTIGNSNRQRERRNSGNSSSLFVRKNYINFFFLFLRLLQQQQQICLRLFIKKLCQPVSCQIVSTTFVTPLGVKYLTRLRTGFSHLKEHKFRYNLQDSIHTMYCCSSGIERRSHFFFHCAHYNTQRKALIDRIPFW